MASSMRNGTMSERIATARFLFETFVPITRTDSSFSTHASICRFDEQHTACGCPSLPRGILSTSLRIRIDTTARSILPSKYASARFIGGFQCTTFAAFLFNSITIITFIGRHHQQLTSHPPTIHPVLFYHFYLFFDNIPLILRRHLRRRHRHRSCRITPIHRRVDRAKTKIPRWTLKRYHHLRVSFQLVFSSSLLTSSLLGFKLASVPMMVKTASVTQVEIALKNGLVLNCSCGPTIQTILDKSRTVDHLIFLSIVCSLLSALDTINFIFFPIPSCSSPFLCLRQTYDELVKSDQITVCMFICIAVSYKTENFDLIEAGDARFTCFAVALFFFYFLRILLYVVFLGVCF